MRAWGQLTRSPHRSSKKKNQRKGCQAKSQGELEEEKGFPRGSRASLDPLVGPIYSRP